MERTRRLAQRLGHPFSSNYALWWTAWLALELGERAPAERAVAASYDYAQEQSFATWRVWGLSHGARLMLEHGEPGQAAFELGRALEQNRYVGLGTVVPFILAQLGRALCRLARPDAGLERIEEALRLIESGGTRWPEVEVLRARAQCQVAIGDGAAAETTLLRALAVAERQQARMFGLRAARDLARLWAGRGERRRAHDLLAPLCAWFTEGLETRDLREAKALLDALA
jgi:tetratricopeptide (TPR) repeat protein